MVRAELEGEDLERPADAGRVGVQADVGHCGVRFPPEALDPCLLDTCRIGRLGAAQLG